MTYRAFFPGVYPIDVLNADNKRYPLRENPQDLIADIQMAWHREAEHIIPYEIAADGTVTPLQMRVHRNVEIHR